MLFINHNNVPPTSHYCNPDECIKIGNMVIPGKINPLKLPKGIYVDGGPLAAVPEGHRVTREYRRIIDRKSFVLYETEPIPDPNLLEAQQKLQDAGAVEAVVQVLTRVMTIAAYGVEPKEWTFKAIIDAASKVTPADLLTRIALNEHLSALQAEWNWVVYHCGSIYDADRLWPYMVEIVRPTPVVVPDPVTE